MKRWFIGFAVIALFSLSCGGGRASRVSPSEVMLSYQPLNNEYVQYKANTNIETNVGGQTRTWMSETRANVKVIDMKDDGSIVREMVYGDFAMGEISGTGTLVPKPGAEDYIGEKVRFTIDAQGKNVDWKGLEGITGMTIEGNTYKDFIVQQLTEIYQPLPDYPVVVGGKWQRTVETQIPVGGGDLLNKVQIDYELVGFGNKGGRECARIKTKYVITANAAGRRRGKFWITVVGDGSGELWFDYVNGLMVEYSKIVTLTRDYSYERAGEEDVASQSTTVDREFKVKLES